MKRDCFIEEGPQNIHKWTSWMYSRKSYFILSYIQEELQYSNILITLVLISSEYLLWAVIYRRYNY